MTRTVTKVQHTHALTGGWGQQKGDTHMCRTSRQVRMTSTGKPERLRAETAWTLIMCSSQRTDSTVQACPLNRARCNRSDQSPPYYSQIFRLFQPHSQQVAHWAPRSQRSTRCVLILRSLSTVLTRKRFNYPLRFICSQSSSNSVFRTLVNQTIKTSVVLILLPTSK